MVLANPTNQVFRERRSRSKVCMGETGKGRRSTKSAAQHTKSTNKEVLLQCSSGSSAVQNSNRGILKFKKQPKSRQKSMPCPSHPYE